MMQLLDVHSVTKPIDFNFLINIGVIMSSMFLGIMISGFPTISNCSITKLEQIKQCHAILSEFHYRGDIIEHAYYTRINRKTGVFFFK